jgi:glycine cleavage system transcriptional repressor
MDQHVILTAIGADRPGLVDEVSQFIFQRGGNIADSRMVNLRGQFAIMVLLSGSPETVSRLESDLGGLCAKAGLHAEVRPASPAKPQATALSQARPYRLRATAMDQSGLVHRIAHLLREHNVNIESLDSRLSAAPISGAPIFEMDLVLTVPQQVPLPTLRSALGKLCDDLNIDWQLAAM